MKKITLKNIKIESWRGQYYNIDFTGNSIIYGANKTGKSTIKDSFLWVLTGFDSNNRSNFNLFDNKREYTASDNPVASVELVLEIDGNVYNFKRTAQIGFVRRRESGDYERKGVDNYKFYLDSIELSSGEYKSRIRDLICDNEVLRIILDIKYFLSLDWTKQREFLGKMAGNIERSDYIGNYDELFSQLERYSLAELKARVSTNIKPLKDSLDSLPLTIKALSENLPDITECIDAESRVTLLKKEIDVIDNELQGVSDSIKPYIDKRNDEQRKIEELKRDLSKKKSGFDVEQRILPEKLKREKKEIESLNREMLRQKEWNLSNISSIKERIRYLQKEVNSCSAKRENLLEKRDAISSIVFDQNTCNYCGQELPYEKIEELKKAFFEERDIEKKNIIAEGKRNNEIKENYQNEILELEKKLSGISTDFELKSTDEIDQKIIEAESNILKFEDTDYYIDAMRTISDLESNLTVIPKQDNGLLLQRKREIMIQIEEESKKIAILGEREKQEKKIDTYRKQLTDTSQALAEQERIKKQIKDYEEEKANIVSKKVNKYFERCRISMMSQDKSGEWIPNCVIKGKDGTEYSTCNGAEKILLGIDVSNAFCKFFEVSLPVFVDDVNLISDYGEVKTFNQSILLHVSDNDKILVKNG